MNDIAEAVKKLKNSDSIVVLNKALSDPPSAVNDAR